ncbi:hypothetical protein DEO72_LG3g2723 [Vigna unguiculata]|uniref:Uncharacterized protein n=1 Tax=Vigna unguiculata TaxID=3917 RepID=A0A4D6LHZ6_VIGUN|nr:hypothetical protein DEO72_LG3g2723 [Vigna unguiculata]
MSQLLIELRPYPLFRVQNSRTQHCSSSSHSVAKLLFLSVQTPPHSAAPLRHRPPQPPLCSAEGCHCSVPLCCDVVAIRQRFEGAAVEELWFVPAPHSCFGVSCWWQMIRVLLVSNSGEVHCGGVHGEAMVARFATTNGGEVRYGESLKI